MPKKQEKKSYYGFDGESFDYIGDFPDLPSAFEADEDKDYLFIADEDHWTKIHAQMTLRLASTLGDD
jgi:hypothetical protein